ncbi:MAG: NAD(P)H-hydrate dehydratase [Alphaproteobacteria bacterium]|uniref:Bifunctional NAD(P)H-hydrate repair enzyme n=1 Tax=Candidatus Nitrobium versatile TaxID=2884831 RepID=A0A953J8S1_9BACT|nr:NAD(P)H-hydrate dehydratase [Candidatus Nitrobium versatile]
MKVATAQEMREIDRITIEEYGIPGPVLMERAGLAVARKVREFFPRKKAVVLCGGGNNGGDGLVAARDLFNGGNAVQVFLLAKKGALSPDCAAQYRIAKKMGVPVTFCRTVEAEEFRDAVVIDALFGTGLGRPVQGELARLFSRVNATDVPVISVDIPSGISSDTGEVMGEAIAADYTVTFGLPKRGHLLYPGAGYAGALFVEDIGFPSSLVAADTIPVERVDRDSVAGMIAPRRRNSYKGDYGHVLVIAGSRGKTGAALMTARACLRSGTGLVTLGVPETLLDVFQGGVTEEMCIPLPDDGTGMLGTGSAEEILEFSAQKTDVIAVGPGIGVSGGTLRVMEELVKRSTVPLVIDADGINALGRAAGDEKGIRDLLGSAKSPVVLTPHPGEMARLLPGSGYGSGEVERERIDIALSFAKETGTYLVLKGVPTVTASPEGNAFLNTSGNPGMATGGSGDVLTGVIASLLGQEMSPLHAAVLGVYLHGLAGDCAAAQKGEHSLIASDIIHSLPDAFAACRTGKEK